MTIPNYFLLRTADGFVGYWDGAAALSPNVPRGKGLTFETPHEATLWAERIRAQGIGVDVVNRDGDVVIIEDTAEDDAAWLASMIDRHGHGGI